ncbi:hypothetical protein [Pseudomonas nitroreducens]|uniref:hypothetical protein n=1 Tax=Pseudomonas nitroreducens TaxID=46680 RepID=UPI00147C7996|nr:hypothetical protein [Pseudomonas nitroreducens]
MDVKTKGVEFDVYDNKENFLGDMFVTKSGLVWCKGKTKKENGVRVSWEEFIAWMES